MLMLGNYFPGGHMKRLIAITAAALILTGCSAPAASQPAAQHVETLTATPTPTPTVLEPGKFTFTNATGAMGTLEVPGTPDLEIEGLRALAGGEPTTYLTVSVDNRNGTVGVNMYGVSIFTPEGKELKYTGADTYLNSLRPSNAPAKVYNQFIEAGNRHMEMAKPNAVKNFVLVGPEVPAEFTAITVYPTGMSDPVDATPLK